MMDNSVIPTLQLPLFDYGESVTNVVELFPAVWKSTESLTSPEAADRQHGLNELVELGAQKVSPLVAYMVVTCINDPDLRIRRQVINVVADLLCVDPDRRPVSEAIRLTLTHFLHHMRESTVYGMLEVAIEDPGAEKPIFQVFNACPYVGRYLGDILSERKNPLAIRQKAVYFIGLVGYLDVLPVLERMVSRLEARQNGQYAMAFAPPAVKSEDELLPYLQVAIDQLTT